LLQPLVPLLNKGSATNGSSSTPTKTKTVLPSLYAVSNTYYERMEPNHYVRRLNIRLVLDVVK
jgi:hypothetical protein